MDSTPYWKKQTNKKKKTIDTITKMLMILLVIMVLMETVMDPVGFYW